MDSVLITPAGCTEAGPPVLIEQPSFFIPGINRPVLGDGVQAGPSDGILNAVHGGDL